MEKDYHLSKENDAEHVESADPAAPQLHHTDNVEAYKSYHGEGKVKEVANVRARSVFSVTQSPYPGDALTCARDMFIGRACESAERGSSTTMESRIVASVS